MDFPVNVRTEIAFSATGDPSGWEWTDVTPDLSGGVPVEITRGRDDEQGQLSPSECRFELFNLDGAYTPGNPLSKHYPNVQVGSPVRVSLPDMVEDDTFLRFSGLASQKVATRGTGFTQQAIDVRVELEPDTWRPDGLAVLASAMGLEGAWILAVGDDYYLDRGKGYLLLVAIVHPVEDEDNWGEILVPSARPIPEDTGRIVVRAVFDPFSDTLGFYVGETFNGPWESLGVPDELPTIGDLRLRDEPTQVLIGSMQRDDMGIADGESVFAGDVYAFQLHDPSSGTTLLDADFTRIPVAAGAVIDGVGETWEFPSSMVEGHAGYRFYGHVSDLLPSWPHGDISRGNDPGESVVEVTASGVSRRLGQGNAPLGSPMFRRLQDPYVRGHAKAYWPGEDGENSTRMSAGFDHEPMEIIRSIVFESDVDFAAFDGFPGSGPVPEFHASPMRGTVPFYDFGPGWDGGLDRGSWVSFMLHVPEDGVDDTVRLMTVTTDGTAAEVVLWLHSDGTTSLSIFDNDLNETSGGQVGESLNGVADLFHLSVDEPVTGGTFVSLWDSGGRFTPSVQSNSLEVGRVTTVVIGDPAGDLGGVAVGHIAVLHGRLYSPADIEGAHGGHAGEPAAVRMSRLCGEQDIPLRIIGDPFATAPMGPQPVKSLVELLQECADADGGILSETRHEPGFTYRTRESLYNQDVRVTLDAASPAGGDITNPFAPVLDDQSVRNDITVEREGGASHRVLDQGDIDRRGLYDESVALNVAEDVQLPDIAGWQLHLGTWRGMRYPSVSPALGANPGLIGPWEQVNLGDRIEVVNLPPQHPGDVSLIVQGYSESWLPDHVEVEANTTPAELWDVGVYEVSRFDAEGSALGADLGEDDTTVLVAPVRPGDVSSEWSDEAKDLPYIVDIEGEHVRLVSAPVVRDFFEREEINGWGVPNAGNEEWTTEGGDHLFLVDEGAGRMVLPEPGHPLWALFDPGLQEADIRAAFALQDPPEGGPTIVALAARQAGNEGAYLARAIFYENNFAVDIIQTKDGVETNLGWAEPSIIIGPGLRYQFRFLVTGESLKLKIWQTSEPEQWDIEAVVDGGAVVDKVGAYARLSSNSSAGPTSVSWFSLEGTPPGVFQRFNVDRSVNNVRKKHSAGAPVRLAFPAVAAL